MNGLQGSVNTTMNWVLIPVALVLLISGCATMGKNECLNAQWQNIGYEDGAKGYGGQRIGEHRKACAKYNVTPDLRGYTQGRLQGLREYCTPSKGYHLGASGKRYNGVCPGELEAAFKLAMNEGKIVYDYSMKVKNREHELTRLQKDLDTIEEEIVLMEAELISDNVRPERRRVLLDDIRKAEKERDLVRDDIVDAEYGLVAMQRKLRRMKGQNSY